MVRLGEIVYFKDCNTSGIGIVKGIGIDHYFVTDPLGTDESHFIGIDEFGDISDIQMSTLYETDKFRTFALDEVRAPTEIELKKALSLVIGKRITWGIRFLSAVIEGFGISEEEKIIIFKEGSARTSPGSTGFQMKTDEFRNGGEDLEIILRSGMQFVEVNEEFEDFVFSLEKGDFITWDQGNYAIEVESATGPLINSRREYDTKTGEMFENVKYGFDLSQHYIVDLRKVKVECSDTEIEPPFKTRTIIERGEYGESRNIDVQEGRMLINIKSRNQAIEAMKFLKSFIDSNAEI
ncbi:hypothetical protein Ab1vBOLIVR5_gp197c [Agrobacterium phage OLIVR5]|uniref:Uncharacterized protein n=1 Tax=Agrobacterium phage OLIVR5 TaxID=2723773 RepID=A0A858MZ64_9CAUD|nr:hypothetical protein KNU99_gp204 [Agrobacterium phage OLIVR5]QIW87845.1 hypothetical protein Ab1vBOLIVR5_gp197c [Agrobacterium phage OLIVR5]QIW88110.1 hypothetical protein Ab1vBOLIVR6_gp203c [Agrobacterium phage OLIVR6]